MIAATVEPAIVVPRAPRRYDIDALRVGAVLLLIYFHTACLFMVWPFHIQNLQRSQAASKFVVILGFWHMPLFFVLAGASTWLAMDFRSKQQYLWERLHRLLLPAAFGMLVVIPPQVYVERISTWVPTRMSPHDFHGSYLAFYPHIFDGVYPQGNLSWHHLWFIVYLFFYSLVMLPVVVWLKTTPSGQRFIRWCGDLLAPGRRILLLAVPEIALGLILGTRFPVTHGLIDDWYAHPSFLLIFIYGVMLMANARLMEAVVRNRRVALVLAIVLTLPVFFPQILGWISGRTAVFVFGVARGFCGTSWLLFILGYGRCWLNRPLPGLRYAGRIAYPFYILHQTVIIVMAYYVLRWNMGMAMKYLIISTAALLTTLGLCDLVQRTAPTRYLFGMPPAARLRSAAK